MKKKTNYEGMFFGMIILAWAVLAVVFNVIHHEMPSGKTAGAKTTAAGAVSAVSNEIR